MTGLEWVLLLGSGLVCLASAAVALAGRLQSPASATAVLISLLTAIVFLLAVVNSPPGQQTLHAVGHFGAAVSDSPLGKAWSAWGHAKAIFQLSIATILLPIVFLIALIVGGGVLLPEFLGAAVDFFGGIIALSIVLVRAVLALTKFTAARDRRTAGRHLAADGAPQGLVVEVGATSGRHRAGSEVGQWVADEVRDFLGSLVDFLEMLIALIFWLGFEAYLAWMWWRGLS